MTDMKITILAENTANAGFKPEFGFSAFVEFNGKKLLFDTGASGLFIENAGKLGIDLSKTDFVVLSHGHWDHADGLPHLLTEFDTGKMRFIAHPDIFARKYSQAKKRWLAMPVSKETAEASFNECLFSKKAHEFTEGVVFLGQVPRSYEGDVTRKIPMGETVIEDPLWDDSALVFKTQKGVVLLTGCSHSGILNLAKAAERFGHVYSIIGGFHLGNASEERLDKIISEFKKMRIEELRPGHCTGEHAIDRMEKELGARRITTGEVIIL